MILLEQAQLRHASIFKSFEDKAFDSTYHVNLEHYEDWITDSSCWGLFNDGCLVGTLIVSKLDNDSASIDSIAIDPDCRSRGYGKYLVEFAETVYDSNVMFLEVSTKNNKAIDLYHKLGYNIFDVKRNYYPNGEDAFEMVKKIRE